MPDTTGSECSGKGRGSHVGQKHFEKSEEESIFFYLVPQYTYVNRPKYHLDCGLLKRQTPQLVELHNIT